MIHIPPVNCGFITVFVGYIQKVDFFSGPNYSGPGLGPRKILKSWTEKLEIPDLL